MARFGDTDSLNVSDTADGAVASDAFSAGSLLSSSVCAQAGALPSRRATAVTTQSAAPRRTRDDRELTPE